MLPTRGRTSQCNANSFRVCWETIGEVSRPGRCNFYFAGYGGVKSQSQRTAASVQREKVWNTFRKAPRAPDAEDAASHPEPLSCLC
jgi:hypothetical protein